MRQVKSSQIVIIKAGEPDPPRAEYILSCEIEGQWYEAWGLEGELKWSKTAVVREVCRRCGRWVITDHEYLSLLGGRSPTASYKAVMDVFARTNPVYRLNGGGHTAFYLLRDAVKAMRAFPRWQCHCGNYVDWRNPGAKLFGEFNSRTLRMDGPPCAVCGPVCEAVLIERANLLKQQVKYQQEELRCLKKQFKALRQLVRSGDPAACLSLPGGYGPARTSPS